MSVKQQQGTNAVTVEEMGTQEQEPKKGNLVVWYLSSLSVASSWLKFPQSLSYRITTLQI